MAPEGVAGVEIVPADSAASGATDPTGSASSGSTSASAGSSGSPAPASKWEDDPRAKGMLADLQRERRARQEFERRANENATLAAERHRQIAALTNNRTPTEAEVTDQAVRDRLDQLYPQLKGLTQDDIDALREMRQQSAQLTATVRHHWDAHSKRMMESVYEKVGAEIGELTPRQQRKIVAAYVADAEADPEFLRRHDAGDQTLIDEFVKAYIEDTVEPVRRKTIANEVNRSRAVPSGGNRTLPQLGGKPIDVNDDKAVMDFIMESRKGQFKR
mgnify:CR=1 FL=1